MPTVKEKFNLKVCREVIKVTSLHTNSLIYKKKIFLLMIRETNMKINSRVFEYAKQKSNRYMTILFLT